MLELFFAVCTLKDKDDEDDEDGEDDDFSFFTLIHF